MNLDGIIPVQPVIAVQRLLKFVDVQMPYRLGSGGFWHTAHDDPWSADKYNVVGCDCMGAVCYAYALDRHRLGFNRNPYGRWDILDVEDDVNSNSVIGDARHKQELFVELAKGTPLQPGDVIAYPTIMLTQEHVSSQGARWTDWIRNDDGTIKKWIGHGLLVKEPNNVRVGDHWSNVTVIQCYGPNDRRPAIRVTDCHVMDMHDERWPKSEHRATALRLHPRWMTT